MIGGLSFLAPFALIALIALPALYFLLRITPPPPRRLPLPTLPLVKDLLGHEREPARTPWWLLAIRLGAAAAIILAVAGPRWQPQGAVGQQEGNGPLILLIDDGWSAATGWQTRIARAAAIIENAASRPVYLIATSDERPAMEPEAPRNALARLLSLTPKPHVTLRATALDTAMELLRRDAAASAIWISDSLRDEEDKDTIARFLQGAGNRVEIIASPASAVTALTGTIQTGDGLDVITRRAAPRNESSQGLIRAFDDKGRILGDATFTLPAG